MAKNSIAWNASKAGSNISGLIEEIKSTLALCPLSEEFLGNQLSYDKGGIFAKKNETLEIMPLRSAVLGADKGPTLQIRKELETQLKKYPSHPELHALHAIQVFKDTNQSGVGDQKLNIMRGAVREMGIALFNGADSVSNMIWFMNIYAIFIEAIKDKISRLAKQSHNIPNADLITLRKKLINANMQLTYLLQAKEKTGGLRRIAESLAGTSYVFDAVTLDELRESSRLLLQGQEAANLKNKNKKASHLLYTYFTKTLMLSHIPILRKALIQSLNRMPEIHRDLVLQKRMIILSDGINEFKAAFFNGRATEAKDGAKKLLMFCQQTISEFLETSALTKQFEVDPFLKFTWVTLESKELLSSDEFRHYLGLAVKYLNIVVGKRCYLKNATEQAQEYLFDINNMLQ